MSKNKGNPEVKLSESPTFPSPHEQPGPPDDSLETPDEPEPVKMVRKRITCPRCEGSGTWVSSRTGVRAKTASGELADPKRTCPQCKGKKTVIIWITEEQAEAEKVAKAKAKSEAKAKIDAAARTAKKELDDE